MPNLQDFKDVLGELGLKYREIPGGPDDTTWLQLEGPVPGDFAFDRDGKPIPAPRP